MKKKMPKMYSKYVIVYHQKKNLYIKIPVKSTIKIEKLEAIKV